MRLDACTVQRLGRVQPNLKAPGWICSALRLFSYRRPMPQWRHPLYPFHYMRYTSRVCGYDWLCVCGCAGATECIWFWKHSKMRGSCPQWPCIGRYFSLHDAADLKLHWVSHCLPVPGVLLEAILHTMFHFQNFQLDVCLLSDILKGFFWCPHQSYSRTSS